MKHNNKIIRAIGAMALFLLFVAGAFAVWFYGAYAVMMIYNHCVPAITGWSEISFWQSFGVSLIFSVLGSSTSCGPQRIENKVDSPEERTISVSFSVSFGRLIAQAIVISFVLLVFMIFKGLM